MPAAAGESQVALHADRWARAVSASAGFADTRDARGARDRFLAVAGSRRETVHLHRDAGMLHVHDRRGSHALKVVPYLSYISTSAQASGDLKAPMMGLILKVNVAPGDVVEKGAVIAILESMKMEMRIVAECAGTVATIHCQAGQTVERGAVVAVIAPELP